MHQKFHKLLAVKLWGSDPGALQRLFMVVGSISIAIILLGSAWGFSTVFTGHIIRTAEADAVEICELMLDFAKESILKGTGKDRSVVVTLEDIATLDSLVAPFLDHMNVTKVKIFDQGHRIVYSTDKAIIGKVDAANPRLLSAMTGLIDTKLKEKKITDLNEEKKFSQKVVETYVPIRNGAGKVVGSFEVYLLTGKYDQAIQRGIILATIILMVILFSVFFASLGIISKSVNQVRDAHGLLQQIAITDALTGIANHGYLILRGKEELERAQRSYGIGGVKGLGCILLDLDHFKEINDTYGHPAGDQVLRDFVIRIQSILRPYDLQGRYGGEEFMVLLPETTLNDTSRIAERMLNAVRQRPFATEAGSLTVTASAGIANSTVADQSIEELIKRTDVNLYRAKRSGRDQICSAPAH